MYKKIFQMLFIAYILLVILLQTFVHAGQGWLSPRKITDNIYSDEVASINNDGTKVAYYSDEDGNYSLNVPPGTYSVTALKNCYVPVSIPDITVTDGGIATENFDLETGGNCTPDQPNNPHPESGSKSQPLDLTMSWECSDPDAEDDVTYDVYLGVQTLHHIELHIISGNQTARALHIEGLEPNTTYFWKVVPRDSHGYETAGA